MYDHTAPTTPPLIPPPPRTTRPSRPTVHRLIFAVDVVGSGRFTTGLQLHTRAALYRLVTDACASAGLPWDDSHHEDRGDGILLIPPADLSAEALLGLFTAHLRASLRRYNQTANRDTQLQLRAAAHAGYVCLDGNGAAGRAVTHAFRLLDAPQFRAIMQIENAEFGLITSSYLYTEVVKDAPGLIDPGLYRPLAIANKEVQETAWALIPPAHLRQHGHAPASDIAGLQQHHDLETQGCPWLRQHGLNPEQAAQALASASHQRLHRRPSRPHRVADHHQHALSHQADAVPAWVRGR